MPSIAELNASFSEHRRIRTGGSAPADPHRPIRLGTSDSDTALTVSATPAAAPNGLGDDVDHEYGAGLVDRFVRRARALVVPRIAAGTAGAAFRPP